MLRNLRRIALISCGLLGLLLLQPAASTVAYANCCWDEYCCCDCCCDYCCCCEPEPEKPKCVAKCSTDGGETCGINWGCRVDRSECEVTVGANCNLYPPPGVTGPMVPAMLPEHQFALEDMAAAATAMNLVLYVRYLNCGDFTQVASVHLMPMDPGWVEFGPPKAMVLEECMDPLTMRPIEPLCGDVPYAYWE